MKTVNESGNFTITFPNIDQFYKECDVIESTGDEREWKRNVDRDDPFWVGLSKEEILKSKYCYKEGLEKLETLNLDFNIGGHKRSYKWDENDGDDMDYDRFLDNLPCLNKRTVKKGDGRGKIITIYISIGENCDIGYKDMLYRSYTAMKLVDYLENLNYRTEIIVYDDVARLGRYNGEPIGNLHTEIILKKAEEPLIRGLILNCISPWMLRYHLFKFWNAKFKTNPGYGHTIQFNYVDTKDKIYFRSGECLNKHDADLRLKQLAKKFGFNE